ncbi:glutathione peroxidase [Pseudomonas sp. KNUC1026]|uniref:glutathione peroxidase n=1 Tax=Pseudomonas sp. KNUC1026 TaxID=2893890 RepID=UPI001F372330|nr:glutathione peroxidase [Pseudomonas sp. KNUC1026]UFH48635.1 glutathione peroxidase [Pseudomonas sp. KNUC1026]
MSDFHSFELRTLEGKPLPLSTFKGKVVLVVNVASKCGLTPQYAALEALHKSHAERGFSVLGLPCNQFGGQEPGGAEDIQRFCSLNYGVSFPMGEKLEVNGEARHPLYQWLVGEGDDISWNFEKFLIGRDGRVLAHFSPRTAPDAPEVTQAVEKAIAG